MLYPVPPLTVRIHLVRYDAAIIGAGANGLTAAAVLSRAGLKTLVVERADRTGGRLATDMFHPGFAASPFADRVPEIPAEVTAALGLAAPLRIETLPQDVRAAPRRRAGANLRRGAPARIATDCWRGCGGRSGAVAVAPAWPGQDLAARPLSDWPALSAGALMGRATDPDLAGSALTLLALAGRRAASGRAWARWARPSPPPRRRAELRLGLEAGEVTVTRGRLRQPGGRDRAGRWQPYRGRCRDLDPGFQAQHPFPVSLVSAAAGHDRRPRPFPHGRRRGALAAGPEAASSGCTAPLLLAGDDAARAAFRRGAVPKLPPLLIDPVSARDPSLAPPGGATLTVTMAGIPARLFDGGWTHEKRLALAAAALRRIEAALPGTLAALVGIRIIAPPDIEERLGASDGDLDGGQLAPDQMLALRPGARTALAGFYLGGASTAAGPLGTGAAGYAAALSLLADR